MTTLRELVVPVDRLFLDPNNPRFADLQDKLQPVAPDRITEQGVQQKALARILDDRRSHKKEGILHPRRIPGPTHPLQSNRPRRRPTLLHPPRRPGHPPKICLSLRLIHSVCTRTRCDRARFCPRLSRRGTAWRARLSLRVFLSAVLVALPRLVAAGSSDRFFSVRHLSLTCLAATA
jgi:hypothetical protein